MIVFFYSIEFILISTVSEFDAVNLYEYNNSMIMSMYYLFYKIVCENTEINKNSPF